jgi:hypothetical protein
MLLSGPTHVIRTEESIKDRGKKKEWNDISRQTIIMFSKALLVLTALALAVNAQSTTATSPAASGSSAAGGLTPCILACVTPAAAQNGCSGPYVFPSSSFSQLGLNCFQAPTCLASARVSNSRSTPLPAYRNTARLLTFKLLSSSSSKVALPVMPCPFC